MLKFLQKGPKDVCRDGVNRESPGREGYGGWEVEVLKWYQAGEIRENHAKLKRRKPKRGREPEMQGA